MASSRGPPSSLIKHGSKVSFLAFLAHSSLSPQVLQGRVHDLGRRTALRSSALNDLLGGRRTENGERILVLFGLTRSQTLYPTPVLSLNLVFLMLFCSLVTSGKAIHVCFSPFRSYNWYIGIYEDCVDLYGLKSEAFSLWLTILSVLDVALSTDVRQYGLRSSTPRLKPGACKSSI